MSRLVRIAYLTIIVNIIGHWLMVSSVSASYREDYVPIMTIALEAQGEPIEGQRAIGEVIRSRSKRSNKTFSEVCLTPYQFSCWNGPIKPSNASKRVSGEAFQRAARAWAESEHSNITGGARHYCRYDVTPYWAGGRDGQRIGNHVFYKGVK